MAVIRRKHGLYFVWPLNGKQVWIKSYCKTMAEAERLERECLTAMEIKDFSFLSPHAREVLVRIHQNRAWTIPAGLIPETGEEKPQIREIVLWHKSSGAVQLFFSDPIVRQKPQSTLSRYTQCIHHLIRLLGANTPVNNIWTPELKTYYATRIKEGASPNTVGWEISTLSAIYGILVDNKRTTGVVDNPCKHIRGRELSFVSRQRQSYLSRSHVDTILTAYNLKTRRSVTPDWLKPIIQTSFYSGMRMGEVLGLRRGQVHLSRRMIFLSGMDTKERQPKRVPIHRDLLPILERAMQVTALGNDRVFIMVDQRGGAPRPITKDAVECAWSRIRRVLKPDPSFNFHDLRHTFRANCARSGISDRIAERILGHSDKEGHLDGKLPVNQRYGEISDEELLKAIDHLEVDHGESRIDGRPVILSRVSWVSVNESPLEDSDEYFELSS
jgi:integrase